MLQYSKLSLKLQLCSYVVRRVQKPEVGTLRRDSVPCVQLPHKCGVLLRHRLLLRWHWCPSGAWQQLTVPSCHSHAEKLRLGHEVWARAVIKADMSQNFTSVSDLEGQGLLFCRYTSVRPEPDGGSQDVLSAKGNR